MTLSEKISDGLPVKEGAVVSQSDSQSTTAPATKEILPFPLESLVISDSNFHSRYDSVFRKSPSQPTCAQGSGSLQKITDQTQLKSSWVLSLSFISHVERKLMKAFRNSYPAYLFLYSFYFMSTALFTTLISVYLIGQQYSASQVSNLVSTAFFLSMLTQPLFGISMNDLVLLKSRP